MNYHPRNELQEIFVSGKYSTQKLKSILNCGLKHSYNSHNYDYGKNTDDNPKLLEEFLNGWFLKTGVQEHKLA